MRYKLLALLALVFVSAHASAGSMTVQLIGPEHAGDGVIRAGMIIDVTGYTFRSGVAGGFTISCPGLSIPVHYGMVAPRPVYSAGDDWTVRILVPMPTVPATYPTGPLTSGQCRTCNFAWTASFNATPGLTSPGSVVSITGEGASITVVPAEEKRGNSIPITLCGNGQTSCDRE